MTCREFRQQHGYTLKDLSAETGYCISAISKWERECETMPQEFCDKMFEKFNVVIKKQQRYFLFNEEHQEVVEELRNEIDELYKTIDKLQEENAKLKLKVESIQAICKG